MKLVVALCLYFISIYHLGCAADETVPAAPTPGDTTSSSPTLVPSTSESNTATTTDNLVTLESTTETATKNAVAAESPHPTTTSSTESPPPTSAAVDVQNRTVVSESAAAAAPAPEAKESVNTTNFIDNLSTQIRSVIQHFQSSEPIGFPGQTILPDPMPAPDRNESLGLGTGYFSNITVHGLSNFTVKSVNTFLDELKVYVEIEMKHVFVLGNCTVEAFLISTKGPFNITLEKVTAEGTVLLTVEPDGTVRATKSKTNMIYEKLNFQYGVNGTSSLMESIISGAGIAVITAIRPYILQSLDERLTQEVNRQLKDSPKFPRISKVSPVDLAVMEARKFVASKYDPYTIDNIFNYDSPYLTLGIGPVQLFGLSKFARVGDITLGMANGTVIVKMRVITGVLQGACTFNFNFGKVEPTRNGSAKFSIEHLQFEAIVKQPLNLKRKPVLEDLQLETGPVSVSLDGAGKFDYVVEMLVQLLPTMLRHFVVDALEEPIKRRIQADILDHVDVDSLVVDNLALVESLLANRAN